MKRMSMAAYAGLMAALTYKMRSEGQRSGPFARNAVRMKVASTTQRHRCGTCDACIARIQRAAAKRWRKGERMAIEAELTEVGQEIALMKLQGRWR